MDANARRCLRLSSCRRQIADGDLLLMRPRVRWYAPQDWPTLLICLASPSGHVHAAMAAWWGDDLMCLEVTAGGGRAGELKNMVARWPRKIDVYKPAVLPPFAPPAWFDAQGAIERMKGLTAQPYGWLRLFIVALLQCFMLRRIATWLALHEETKWPPYCMLACLWSYLAGGWNASGATPMQEVTPSDAARSRSFDYAFTLI